MADLIIFPQARNVGKARHVAQLYWNKGNQKDQEIYWRMVVNRLAASMAKCGFSKSSIDQQVSSFRDAVQNQLDARPVRPPEIESAPRQQQVAFEVDGRPS